jgi:hypothetical protein
MPTVSSSVLGKACQAISAERSIRRGTLACTVDRTISESGQRRLDSLIVGLRGFADSLAPSAPLSATLLAGLASELTDDTPISRLLLGHPASGEVLAGIRALSGVNRLFLSGLAPELATHIAKGVADEHTWPLAREVMLRHPNAIMSALDEPVQQHHPSRSEALLRGLAALSARRIRLLEIGACAGLNLILDHYHWIGTNWDWGDLSASLQLPGTGRKPGSLEIVERMGCDLRPRDPAAPQDVLALRSFVPPENVTELAQLDAALAIRARVPVDIRQESASTWLSTVLAEPATRGVTTVVWHSLVWHYVSPAEQQAIGRILKEAGNRMPLAWIGFEPDRWAAPAKLNVRRL